MQLFKTCNILFLFHILLVYHVLFYKRTPVSIVIKQLLFHHVQLFLYTAVVEVKWLISNWWLSCQQWMNHWIRWYLEWQYRHYWTTVWTSNSTYLFCVPSYHSQGWRWKYTEHLTIHISETKVYFIACLHLTIKSGTHYLL